MSKKWIAVCAAALSFAACDEGKPQTPVIPSKVVTRAIVRPVVAATVFDAGSKLNELALVDSLALSHDTPSVDHLDRARKLEADEDLSGALAEARRALYTTPSDEEAVELIARLARRSGKPTLCAQAWERLATFRPTDATPSIQQARALFKAKDYAGMVIAGREAISRDSENAEAHHLVGLGQLSLGDLTSAMGSFERAVEISPEHGYALNNLGLTYLRANENAKAVDVLERASALLPTVAYVQNNYGVALERMGRRDEAKAAYQHAMDLSPKYVKARLNAARVAKVQIEPEDIEDEPLNDVPHPMPQ